MYHRFICQSTTVSIHWCWWCHFGCEVRCVLWRSGPLRVPHVRLPVLRPLLEGAAPRLSAAAGLSERRSGTAGGCQERSGAGGLPGGWNPVVPSLRAANLRGYGGTIRGATLDQEPLQPLRSCLRCQLFGDQCWTNPTGLEWSQRYHAHSSFDSVASFFTSMIWLLIILNASKCSISFRESWGIYAAWILGNLGTTWGSVSFGHAQNYMEWCPVFVVGNPGSQGGCLGSRAGDLGPCAAFLDPRATWRHVCQGHLQGTLQVWTGRSAAERQNRVPSQGQAR